MNIYILLVLSFLSFGVLCADISIEQKKLLSNINNIWSANNADSKTIDIDEIDKIWLIAAQNGRIDVLEWLKQNKVPGVEQKDILSDRTLWQMAAEGPDQAKSRQVLQWFFANDIPGREEFVKNLDTNLLKSIIYSCNFNVIDWLHKKKYLNYNKLLKIIPLPKLIKAAAKCWNCNTAKID